MTCTVQVSVPRMKGLEITLQRDNLAVGSLATNCAKLKQIVSNFLEKPVAWELLKQALASVGHLTPD